MRILVTGASGVFGRDVTRRLWMKGHDVVALSRRRPELLPPGVEFVPADIRDALKVEKAMAGCDAVVHLAWTVTPSRRREDHEEIDIGGTQNVLDAMSRTGCGRIVFASSVTAYGAHADNPPFLKETDPLRPNPQQVYATNKARAEAMIRATGASAVLVRAGVVLGREVDNVGMRLFATPALVQVRGDPGRLQLLHPEDIGRFFADACAADRTGTVNLAADDVLSMAEIGRLVGKRVLVVGERTLRRALELLWRYDLAEVDPDAFDTLRFMPVVDTTRLRKEWGFRCGWTTAEAISDFARWTGWFRYLGKRRVELPWRTKYPTTRVPLEVPPPDGGDLVPASDPELAGELDNLVDPRFPTYTATNTSEAFPGPLTPLSLEVGLRSMRAAAEMTGFVIGIREPLMSHLWHRSTGMFGHALYANLSVIHEMAREMPGYDAEAWNELMFGGAETRASTEAPKPASETLRTAARVVPRLAYFSREIARFEREMPGLCLSEEQVRVLSDERLGARLALMHDMVVYAWGLAATASAWAAAVFGAIEKKAGRSVAASIRGGRERLASAGALLAVQRLADAARRDPAVAEILGSLPPSEALDAVRASAPSFARLLDEAVARHGHRGPWETELANRMFGDAPELLLDSVAKHLAAPERPAPPTVPLRPDVRAMARIGHHFQRTRERGRDAAMRMTHQYRIAARERGRRLAAAGALADETDVFYLTLEQALEPPPDVAAIVERRRRERERLSRLRMPMMFTGRWEPVSVERAPLAPGESITGIPASPGVARGRVRILTSGTSDDLQPGEVLVAKLTDTGWTPLFGYAAAVVTDMGGQLSHAAVVAREFGIPCVVQAEEATARLRTGQTVEVDGAAGTVRALD